MEFEVDVTFFIKADTPAEAWHRLNDLLHEVQDETGWRDEWEMLNVAAAVRVIE